MLKKIVAILLLLLVHFNGTCQNNYGKKYHFAIGIFFSANSQLITYAVITEINGVFVGTQILNKQRFMYYILGHWPTPANPQRKNLLEAHGIDSCFLTVNYSNKINGYYAKPFHDLWKLRYNTHPISYDLPSGWSQDTYKPSMAQTNFLYQNYGVKNIKLDYFYGDSLYKLLHDMQKPEWVLTYSTVRDSI